MQTYSIGIVHLEDNELQLLATLNNQGNILSAEEFTALAKRIAQTFEKYGESVVILERMDAENFVDLE